jgi:hypothetical protein
MAKEPYKDPFANLPPRRLFVEAASPPAPAKITTRVAPAQKLDEAKAALDDAKSKGGRPVTVGKPWEALGISRAAYYKRQRKEQSE